VLLARTRLQIPGFGCNCAGVVPKLHSRLKAFGPSFLEGFAILEGFSHCAIANLMERHANRNTKLSIASLLALSVVAPASAQRSS
jgi:hypothetical protein